MQKLTLVYNATSSSFAHSDAFVYVNSLLKAHTMRSLVRKTFESFPRRDNIAVCIFLENIARMIPENLGECLDKYCDREREKIIKVRNNILII